MNFNSEKANKNILNLLIAGVIVYLVIGWLDNEAKKMRQATSNARSGAIDNAYGR